jgi:uncharacterized protein (DUF2132 family)
MNDEINYKNNPLHGVSLKNLLIEMVELYGFDILFAYLNINCFKTNPSIESSVKFLKKTDWARENVESFYLYQFKNLPRASDEQFELQPRDRIVPEGHSPGRPAELSLEDAERLRAKRAKKAAERDSNPTPRRGSENRSGGGPRERTRSNTNSRDNTRDNNSGSKPARKPSEGTADKAGNDPWANWRS